MASTAIGISVNSMAMRGQRRGRKMTPSPEKIVELRNKVAMNQAALAGAAKVSVRTGQRAEAGEPIELHTSQHIATALGVLASAILLAETVEGPEPGDEASSAPDGNMSVALRP